MRDQDDRGERPKAHRDVCHKLIVHDAALCYDRRVMNMPVMSFLAVDRAAVLDRHARRRTAGIPTVSLLVGPIEASVRTWRRWANFNGQRVITAKPTLFPDEEWVRSVAEEVDLPVAALHSAARRAGRDPNELLAEWRAKTPADRERFFQQVLLEAGAAENAVAAIAVAVADAGNTPRIGRRRDSSHGRPADDPGGRRPRPQRRRTISVHSSWNLCPKRPGGSS